MRDGFERHGITTEMISQYSKPDNDFVATYMAYRWWDWVLFMRHAEIRIKYKGRLVGYGEYHLKGNGGWSVYKWQSTKTKMDPIMDELLKEYPVVFPGKNKLD